MQTLHDLEILLNSRIPIILIESLEEQRVVRLFARMGLRIGQPIFQWTITQGLRRLDLDLGPQRTNSDPTDALRHIAAATLPGVYLLLDFHPYTGDPLHIRLLKEIAQDYDDVGKTLVLVSFSLTTPPEIRHLTARFTLRLPDRAAIRVLIQEEAVKWQSNSRSELKVDPRAVERLAGNLLGVTSSDARRLIRAAIEDDGAIGQDDLPRVMQAKYELIDRQGVISFEYDTARFRDVAGLSRLKAWLEQRRERFQGKQISVDHPRGIMLLGVQGGGKSLAAKAVAGSFGLPLLRLDFATLYDKYIGETEKNLRHALATAEAMAPCVLWMDEVEKGLARSSGDEGLSQRILGTLLTWMSEHEANVFVVATSNDIQSLPPELVRKGRLDEIFFVDLPDHASRSKIFSIHLRRRNQAPSGFDLDALAYASEGFTGAEIEQAIVSALYAAQAQDLPLDGPGLLSELERTSPLSVVMAEKIARLRAWAAGRAVAAD